MFLLPPPLETYGLSSIDDSLVKKIFKLSYPNGRDNEQFFIEQNPLLQTIELAHKNGAEIAFVVTPALFGKWPGHDQMIEELSKVIPYNIPIYDYSDSMLSAGLYADHHHLNREGIIQFTQHYLKQVLDNMKNDGS